MSGTTAQLFTVTMFRDYAASTKTEVRTDIEALATRIRASEAQRKDDLPWLKLARFGELRSQKNSLRHDANVVKISGIEGDYDGEKIPFDDAVECLTQQGVASICYTSPSHCENAPRWRALCPLSEELPPGRRNHQMGRLNGLFRGIFAGESWTLSQSFYFGSVNRNPAHRVEVIDGHPIDKHDDLDTIWLGKSDASNSGAGAAQHMGRETREDAELIRCVVTGEHLHAELCALAARYVARGLHTTIVSNLLKGIMLSHPESARDARWLDRYQDIDRTIASAVAKFRSEARGNRKSIARLALSLVGWRRPDNEVRWHVLREAEAAGLTIEDAEKIIAWARRQRRTGADAP